MLPLSRISCLGEALRDTVIVHKGQTAMIEVDRHRENGRWTYRDVWNEAERFAALMQGEGIDSADRVAVVMSNQARWLLSATAAFWSAAVLVPVDYKLTPEEQAGVLGHAKPAALVVEYPAWRKLGPALAEAGVDIARVYVTEAPEGAALDAATRWESDPAAAFALRHASRGDLACIVYSSGTGGDVKGCMLTHGNYLAQAESLGELYPMAEGDRYFSILPTNHAIDFMCGYLIPFLFGASVVHQRTLRPELLRYTIKRYGITHMALVPALLKAFEERFREKLDALEGGRRALADGLIRLNELATMKQPRPGLSRRLLAPVHDELGGRLRFIFAGGAFVAAETAEFFYHLGVPVVIGYGLTEAGTVLTVNDLKPFRADTVGRPVDGVELEVRDADEAGVGEVWVRGPTVMRGYLDDDALTAETIVDGWLRTGDLGLVDPAGHLKLVGRTRNMIVTEGGKNIYPEDIENAFEGIDGVEELGVFAADYVFGAPRGGDGGGLGRERLLVVIRLDGDGGDWLVALQDRNRRLAEYKRVSGFVVWEREFPRTASMKVKRGVLAKEIAAETTRAAIRELES